MKVNELIKFLQTADQDADVLIRDNGSILKTDTLEETEDYNFDYHDTNEVFIVTVPY